jgi:hypothetical protein
MSSFDLKWMPLSELFNYGKIKRSQGSISDEYGAFSNIGITGEFFGTILAHKLLVFTFVIKSCLAVSYSTLPLSL